MLKPLWVMVYFFFSGYFEFNIYKKINIFETLIELGADVNHSNKENVTPLEFFLLQDSSSETHDQITSFFIGKGAILYFSNKQKLSSYRTQFSIKIKSLKLKSSVYKERSEKIDAFFKVVVDFNKASDLNMKARLLMSIHDFLGKDPSLKNEINRDGYGLQDLVPELNLTNSTLP